MKNMMITYEIETKKVMMKKNVSETSAEAPIYNAQKRTHEAS